MSDGHEDGQSSESEEEGRIEEGRIEEGSDVLGEFAADDLAPL